MSDMAFPSFQKRETFDDRRGEYVDDWLPVGGMELRDYFAAKAMPQAIRHMLRVRSGQINPSEFDYERVASTAYKMADAMLKAREKQS